MLHGPVEQTRLDVLSRLNAAGRPDPSRDWHGPDPRQEALIAFDTVTPALRLPMFRALWHAADPRGQARVHVAWPDQVAVLLPRIHRRACSGESDTLHVTLQRHRRLLPNQVVAEIDGAGRLDPVGEAELNAWNIQPGDVLFTVQRHGCTPGRRPGGDCHHGSLLNLSVLWID